MLILVSVMKILVIKQNDIIIGMCQVIAVEWNAKEGTKVFSEIPKAIGPRSSQAGTLVFGQWRCIGVGNRDHEWLSLL